MRRGQPLRRLVHALLQSLSLFHLRALGAAAWDEVLTVEPRLVMAATALEDFGGVDYQLDHLLGHLESHCYYSVDPALRRDERELHGIGWIHIILPFFKK